MRDEVHFYNRQLEVLSSDELRNLQDQRLCALIGEMTANQFYQEKSRVAGLDLARIKTARDLQQLPFTTKQELIDEQHERPPFGGLLSYPLDRYRHFHQTSGTTGRPLKCVDTKEDWEWWMRCWGYVYRAAGVEPGDIVFCAFSFGPYISHWTAISGAWHIGAMCISGGGMNSEQRLRCLLDNRATVIVCTPTYALHLAEVARDLGIDLRSSAVRIGIHAGEPGASLPNVKRAIEEAWGAICFDHAGATEAGAWAFDCEAQSGAIHLNEAEFIFEVIDPLTGECGESLEEGQRGEIVITNLGRVGMPVLRYRTGDLVELTTDPCDCGRGFARIKGGVVGRADDMMIVRGVNLYPSAIDNLIRSLPNISEYEVNISRVAGMDDLTIKIETTSFDETAQALTNAFRTQYSIRVGVEEAAIGSLPRYEFKAKRFKRV